MRKMKKDIYRMIFTVEIQWSSLEEALGDHSASRAASFRGLFEYFSIFYGSVDDWVKSMDARAGFSKGGRRAEAW